MDKYMRYNRSEKGIARRRRYDEKPNPTRRIRQDLASNHAKRERAIHGTRTP